MKIFLNEIKISDDFQRHISKLVTFLILIFFILLSLNGCSKKMHIKEILDHPRVYVDKEVMVYGKVTNTFSLVFISYFEITDETGTIKVVTTEALPKKGEILSVEGTLIYYSLANMNFYAIKEHSVEE